MSTKKAGTSTGSRTTAATALSEMRQAAQVEHLRESNERLSRELSRLKRDREEFVAAIYRAAKDASTGMVIRPVPAPSARRVRGLRAGDDETALAALSDVQLGKVTATYNTDVAEQRVNLYADKIIQLTDIQRSDHPVREVRVYLLGDIVEGELIFPHQPFQIDSSLFRQVAVDGPRIVIDFLRRLLAAFDRVHVVGVIGNHGRLGPRRSPFNPETNMDRMLYQIVADRLKDEPRLTWNLPYVKNERAWYAVDYPFFGQDRHVRGLGTLPLPSGDSSHGFLLFHGDQIPGSANHSVKTVAARLWGWASGAVPEKFNHAIYGHWHTPRFMQLNDMDVWCNGSTESTNVYAQEQLSALGKPNQLLLFCHPRRGVTAEYRVRLD